MNDITSWVVSDDLPIADLRDHDFEECIYWLLDAMNAQELAWRKGSAGKHGTADGGRDLEAKFSIPLPNAEVKEEIWWLDAKGRKGTIERNTVQDVILNAQAEPDLDVFVVATNTTFSNPTRDWVKNFQKKHPKPRIELWDGDDIKRLLSKYPTVVARLFINALSTQGKLDVVSSRFWNAMRYSDCEWLNTIWLERYDLSWDERSAISIVVCEAANGNLSERPWAAVFDDTLLASCLINSLSNVLYFIVKLKDAEGNQEPLINGISYFLSACLIRFKVKTVLSLVRSAFQDSDEKDYPLEVRNIVLEPILNTALGDLLDICSEDCLKVSILKKSNMKEEATFASKFILKDDEVTEDDDRTLTLQKTDEPCKIGLHCENDDCPLTNNEAENCDDASLEKYLDIIQKVTLYRIKNPIMTIGYT